MFIPTITNIDVIIGMQSLVATFLICEIELSRNKSIKYCFVASEGSTYVLGTSTTKAPTIRKIDRALPFNPLLIIGEKRAFLKAMIMLKIGFANPARNARRGKPLHGRLDSPKVCRVWKFPVQSRINSERVVGC